MAYEGNKITNHNFFVLNSMEDWVRIIDTNGETIFINESMIEDNKDGHFLDNILKNYKPFKLGDHTAEVLKTTTIVEEKLIDGKYYSVKTSPVYYDGFFEGVIEVYRDITSESKMKIDLFNANRNMIEDIRFVKKIQNSILPKNSYYGKLKLEGKYLPCEDLSGDFFDIAKIDEDKYAFYIADVMGHGVKSSVMTMFVKLTIGAIFERHPSFGPEQALLKIREKFVDLEMSTSQYFTIWLGIFDLKNNSLTYSNAGHNCPPLLFKNKSFNIEELEVSGRMISNIIEPTKYKEIKVDFNPKDQVLFYTDGVIESKNKQKLNFGIPRLKEQFRKTDNLNEILENISRYTRGEQKDDIALALIEYKD
jgi:sigma-B regulation protein RsbU (phosphoserine phosphatase)